jgi:hypothetical protein
VFGPLNYSWLRRQRRSAPEVFVLGNQKSGTTVIAAALAECAGVSVALDLHAIHNPQATASYVDRSLDVAAIERKCGRRFRAAIVKEPILTFYAQELLEKFPQARFAFVVRDPRDNIRSILNRVGVPGNQKSINTSQWSRILPVWREVIENRRLGLRCENYVERLAERWLAAWRLHTIDPQRLVVVRYEDFIADKIQFTQRLTRRLEFTVRNEHPKSIHKQFQVRGERNASWPEFFGDNLERINRVCNSAMQELAYDALRCSAELPETSADGNDIKHRAA